MSYEKCGEFQFRGGNSTEDEVYIMDHCISNTMRNQVYLFWLIFYLIQSAIMSFFCFREFKKNGRGLKFYLLLFLFADDMSYVIKEIALLTHANQFFRAFMALLSYWMCEMAIATLLHKWLKASLDILDFRQPTERVTFQRFIRSFIITFSILFGFGSTVCWFTGYIILVRTGNKDLYNMMISIGFIWFIICLLVLILWFVYVVKKLFSVIEEDSADLSSPSFSRDSLKYKLLMYTAFEVTVLASAGLACCVIVVLASVMKADASPFYFYLFEVGFNASGVLTTGAIFWILHKGTGDTTNSARYTNRSTQDGKIQKEFEISDIGAKPKVVAIQNEKDVDEKLDIFLQSVQHET